MILQYFHATVKFPSCHSRSGFFPQIKRLQILASKKISRNGCFTCRSAIIGYISYLEISDS